MKRIARNRFIWGAFAAVAVVAVACSQTGRGTAPAVSVPNPVQVQPSAVGVAHVTLVAPTASSEPTAPLSPVPAEATETQTPACVPWFDPVSFLPGGALLVGITHQAGRPGAQIFNLEAGRADSFLPAPYPVLKAAVAPDGWLLAWALEDHVIRLLRLPDGEEVGFLEGHIGPITGLQFTADGERLISASHDGWVRIWSRTGELLSAFHAGEILGMGLASDASELVTIHFDGPPKAWDPERGEQIGEYAGSVGGGYDGAFAAYTPDGAYIAVSFGAGGPVSVFRTADRSEVWTGGMMAVAVSPDGRTFAVGESGDSGSGKVILRSLADQTPLSEFTGHASMVWKVIFSPEGDLLASTSGTDTFVWRPADGEVVFAWQSTCP